MCLFVHSFVRLKLLSKKLRKLELGRVTSTHQGQRPRGEGRNSGPVSSPCLEKLRGASSLKESCPCVQPLMILVPLVFRPGPLQRTMSR